MASAVGIQIPAGYGNTTMANYEGFLRCTFLGEKFIGIGIVYDNSFSDNPSIHFRPSIAYYNQVQLAKPFFLNYKYYYHRFIWMNTFCFDYFNNETVRVWFGLQEGLMYEFSDYQRYLARYRRDYFALSGGIIPFGIDINIADGFTIGIETGLRVSYKLAGATKRIKGIDAEIVGYDYQVLYLARYAISFMFDAGQPPSERTKTLIHNDFFVNISFMYRFKRKPL